MLSFSRSKYFPTPLELYIQIITRVISDSFKQEFNTKLFPGIKKALKEPSETVRILADKIGNIQEEDYEKFLITVNYNLLSHPKGNFMFFQVPSDDILHARIPPHYGLLKNLEEETGRNFINNIREPNIPVTLFINTKTKLLFFVLSYLYHYRQRRKNGSSYFEHPFSLANYSLWLTYEPNFDDFDYNDRDYSLNYEGYSLDDVQTILVSAAFGHDLIEDTPLSKKDLEFLVNNYNEKFPYIKEVTKVIDILTMREDEHSSNPESHAVIDLDALTTKNIEEEINKYKCKKLDYYDRILNGDSLKSMTGRMALIIKVLDVLYNSVEPFDVSDGVNGLLQRDLTNEFWGSFAIRNFYNPAMEIIKNNTKEFSFINIREFFRIITYYTDRNFTDFGMLIPGALPKTIFSEDYILFSSKKVLDELLHLMNGDNKIIMNFKGVFNNKNENDRLINYIGYIRVIPFKIDNDKKINEDEKDKVEYANKLFFFMPKKNIKRIIRDIKRKRPEHYKLHLSIKLNKKVVKFLMKDWEEVLKKIPPSIYYEVPVTITL